MNTERSKGKGEQGLAADQMERSLESWQACVGVPPRLIIRLLSPPESLSL